jgi:hypothetical protein
MGRGEGGWGDLINYTAAEFPHIMVSFVHREEDKKSGRRCVAFDILLKFKQPKEFGQ